MNKHIIDSLRRAYDAFSRGDIQGAVEALDLAPDILWSEPESFYAGGTYRGPQGVAAYLTRSSESSEKAQSLPEEILEVGDKIVVFVHLLTRSEWYGVSSFPRDACHKQREKDFSLDQEGEKGRNLSCFQRKIERKIPDWSHQNLGIYNLWINSLAKRRSGSRFFALGKGKSIISSWTP